MCVLSIAFNCPFLDLYTIQQRSDVGFKLHEEILTTIASTAPRIGTSPSPPVFLTPRPQCSPGVRWDAGVSMVCVLVAIFTPYRMAFADHHSIAWLGFDAIVDILFVVGESESSTLTVSVATRWGISSNIPGEGGCSGRLHTPNACSCAIQPGVNTPETMSCSCLASNI